MENCIWRTIALITLPTGWLIFFAVFPFNILMILPPPISAKQKGTLSFQKHRPKRQQGMKCLSIAVMPHAVYSGPSFRVGNKSIWTLKPCVSTFLTQWRKKKPCSYIVAKHLQAQPKGSVAFTLHATVGSSGDVWPHFPSTPGKELPASRSQQGGAHWERWLLHFSGNCMHTKPTAKPMANLKSLRGGRRRG